MPGEIFADPDIDGMLNLTVPATHGEIELWLTFPTVREGAAGVGFIDAAVQSNMSGGAWTGCS